MSLRTSPIAIVGIGGVFPDALDLDTFWENIKNKQDATREVPASRWIMNPEQAFSKERVPDHTYSKRACLIENFVFDSEGFELPKQMLEQLDPLFHLALHAGRQAFLDANTSSTDRKRIGTCLAAIALPTDGSSALTRSILGRAFAESFLDRSLEQPHPSKWEYLNSRVVGLPASILAKSLRLGAGSYTLDAACASSLYAVKLACDELNAGRVDMMLAGGVSRPENLYTQIGFSQLQALSGTGVCSPFDQKANGLVVGEGAGIFALKRLDTALEDQDHIYGLIRGIGLSNDIGGGLLAPDSEGQVRAMRDAYKEAGWQPNSIDLIECHGTGTPLGDRKEVESLRAVWAEESFEPAQCAIGSVKSQIGHLLTGAAAAGMMKVLLALKNKQLPPSIHFEKASENSPLHGSPFRVQESVSTWPRQSSDIPRRAAVSAFGFGGINAHLLLEEWDSTLQEQILNEAEVTKGSKQSSRLEVGVNHSEAIAIVGMGARVGQAASLDELKEHIFCGKSLIDERPKKRWCGAEHIAESILGEKEWRGAYLDPLNIPIGRYRIPPKEIPEILPQQLLILEVAAAAMKDAGFPLREKRPRMGSVIGVAFDFETTNFHLRWALHRETAEWAKLLGLRLDDEALKVWTNTLQEMIGPGLNATRTVGALGGIVASRVAKEMLLGGPSFIVSDEENAGLRALEIGVRSLQRNEQDAVLVGAVDLAGDLRQFLATHALKPFSAKGQTLPFDLKSEGQAIGEGAAAIVLKRLSDAQRDNDRVYAVVKGIGVASGGGFEQAFPSIEASKTSFERACADANVRPETLQLFEAHGSGIPEEDRSDFEFLASTFVGTEKQCALGSLQGLTGNTGAAAGLLSCVKVGLSLHHTTLAGMAGFRTSAADFDWSQTTLFLPKDEQFWWRDRQDGPRRACVQSKTFDGNAMHVILEGFEQEDAKKIGIERLQKDVLTASSLALPSEPVQGEDEYALFVVEEDSSRGLRDKFEALRNELLKSNLSIAHQAYLWTQKHPLRSEAKYACSFVCSSFEELFRQLRQAETALERDASVTWNGQQGFFYTSEPIGASGKIAFVYPGSGNHYVGMGRQLGVRWPEVLRRMDAVTEQLRSQCLPECYMPWRSDWSEGWEKDSAHYLGSDPHHMIFGQVVHGGIVTDVIRQFGISPDAVIGYSLGESAGLFASGAWPERGHMLERMLDSQLFRTQLAGPCDAVREVWPVPTDKSVDWFPVWVRASAEQVKEFLADDSTARLLIINTPDECVIGGLKHDVQAVVKQLECEFHELEGIVAVHCEVVEPVAKDYRDLHIFPTTPPKGVSFYSGYLGASYELTSENAADSILNQALHGFDYTKTIRQAHQDGIQLFIEMGPQSSCSRMIGKILSGENFFARSACVRGEDEHRTILKCLAALIAQRVPVDLSPLYRCYEELSSSEQVVPQSAHVRVSIGNPPALSSISPSLLDKKETPFSEVKPSEQKQMTGKFSKKKTSKKELSNLSSYKPTPKIAFDAFPAPLKAAPSQVHETNPSFSYQGEKNFISAQPFDFSSFEMKNEYPDPAKTRAFAPNSSSEQTEETSTFAYASAGHAPNVMMQELAQQQLATSQAIANAHQAYLGFSQASVDRTANVFSAQSEWLAAMFQGQEFQIGNGQLSPNDPAQDLSYQLRQYPHNQTEVETETYPTHKVASEPIENSRYIDQGRDVLFDYNQCMEFAIGSVEKVLGTDFAAVDSYPVRVRLPNEPLMLVHRIVSIEGEKGSLSNGKIITEHDVHPDAWYLDANRVPVCISVEAGQADLFLCSYLGIDLAVKGTRSYRLLDADIYFHRGLPQPGERIVYDITIDKFIRQGDVYMFFFRFEGTINGQPLITMENGCAGFFTEEEIVNSGGIVRKELDKASRIGVVKPEWKPLVPIETLSLNEEQSDALRAGNLVQAFGSLFGNLPLQFPTRLPSGRMRLFDRVLELNPKGGRYGLGVVRTQADIHPDDWFLTCHFSDDMVMPGTLMYECCAHSLRVLLMRMGWVGEHATVCYEPVPMVKSQLRCRGPVLATTKIVEYEVEIKEIGYNPAPYVIADALMFGDGEPIVSFEDMTIQATGLNKEMLEAMWQHIDKGQVSSVETGLSTLPSKFSSREGFLYDEKSILAYAEGKPSEAFGDRYQIFDKDRVIARLPRAPYLFLDGIRSVDHEPWSLAAGGWIEGEYKIPSDAWYFRANRQEMMPFCILLEIALQPCGWLAAYVGSALHSKQDLHFRNLGGEATLLHPITSDTGVLTIRVRMNEVSKAGGMIIERFDMEVLSQDQMLYKGNTYFGFFSKQALALQVGILDTEDRLYQPTKQELAEAKQYKFAIKAPLTPDDPARISGKALQLPGKALQMLDTVDLFLPEGGSHGLGFVRGSKQIDPSEWFFQAHFYQDPVCPGSLGLESFLQLLKFYVMERWGEKFAKTHHFEPILIGEPHHWEYRGQILSRPSKVEVDAMITEVRDGAEPVVKASGFLKVDGLFIYEMIDFGIRIVKKTSEKE